MVTVSSNYSTEQRRREAEQIRALYREAAQALRRVGRKLRTSPEGRFLWATKHKTAISGLAASIEILASDVPHFSSDLS